MFEEGQEILERRYRVLKKLGGGAFGEIYKGKSLNAPNSLFQRSSITRSAIITCEDSLVLSESNPAMKSIPAKLIHCDLILCFESLLKSTHNFPLSHQLGPILTHFG